MIAEASLQEKIVDTNKKFDCQGKLKIGPDYVLPEANFKAHGRVDLEEALAVSCNVTFGLISLELGRGQLAKTFDRYGFSRSVPEEIEETASRLPDFDKLSDGDIAQTGIGQGSLLVTPLRMAMLASAFANNGKIMTPYLVQQVTAPNGEVIKQYSASEWLNPVNTTNAGLIRDMMVNVVDDGTGIAAKISGMKVAGKTGTAENPHGAPHAWFIGFAPANQPKIAIAVVVENGGSGGAIAAPIARQLFSQVLL
jgi:peptidoglycan glycosyltransferase